MTNYKSNPSNPYGTQSSESSKEASGSDKVRNFSTAKSKDKSDDKESSFGHDMKSTFNDLETRAEEIGHDLKERGRQLSQQVSTQVKNNPLAYIGGASVAGLAIGYLMGRVGKSRSSSQSHLNR